MTLFNNQYRKSMYYPVTDSRRNKTYSMKVNNWDIINIPTDIPQPEVTNGILNWLSTIVSFQTPTSLQCNLDCSYCYIENKWMKHIHHSSENMLKLLNTVNDEILTFHRNPKVKRGKLTVTSWGAEPFCNLDTLETLVDWATEKHYNIGMSTNGTNNSDKAYEILEKMFSNNLLNDIQVSIDGPEDIQNKNRPFFGGAPSYEYTLKFYRKCKELSNKYAKKNNKKVAINYCSTLPLDNDVCDNYKKLVEFFCVPTSEFFSSVFPLRLEHALFDAEKKDLFIKLHHFSHELVTEMTEKYHIPYIDMHVKKLLFDRRYQKLRICAAMKNQIAIDFDGSMYLCHSALVTPDQRPFFWFGNVFDMVIDYKQWAGNIDMFHSFHTHLHTCKDCPIFTDPMATGIICDACPPMLYAFDELSVPIDYYKCQAYQELMPLWKKVRAEYIIACQRFNKKPIKGRR